MKRILLSFALFAASAAYVAYQYIGGGTTGPVAENMATTSAPVSVSVPISQQPSIQTGTPVQVHPTPTPTPTPTSTPKPQGHYVDGTYTGNAADAYYGNIQVQATIQGGKLTDVTFLQYPNDRRTSQYINSQAMPQLRQEAIQAQSANVSGVSGASDTSAAFRESLKNALAHTKS